MEKYAKELQAGDKTDHYEVLSVSMEDGKVVATVRFNDGGEDRRVWDEPNTILTVHDKLFKLEFGISPLRQVAIAYGARAIYARPGSIELLWDRQSGAGGTPEQLQELCKWINEYGLPALKKLTIDEHIQPDEDKAVTINQDGWFVIANPKQSCGYIYIGIYPVDTGDPNYIPPARPSPKPAPVKKSRKSK